MEIDLIDDHDQLKGLPHIGHTGLLQSPFSYVLMYISSLVKIASVKLSALGRLHQIFSSPSP